jgi:uncharacterized protein
MWGVILGAVAIGVLLGLLGSGGSILTVPILVYGLGHAERKAMAEALAIVAVVAFAGAVPYAAKRQIDWRNVLWFGTPGLIGMYLGAWLSQFFSGAMLLVFLAIMMLLAAGFMIRETLRPAVVGPVEDDQDGERPRHPLWRVTSEGFAVGMVTGLVSVGGGFLIVPALVLLGGLPMRLAVGTSLVIIGLKSLIGFFKQQQIAASEGLAVDWGTVGLFVAFGIAGTLIGKQLNQRINQRWLKRGFALFLVLMAAWIVWREAPEVWRKKTAPAGAVGASLEPVAGNGSSADCPLPYHS